MALTAPGRIELQEGYFLELVASPWTVDRDLPGEAIAAIEHHKRPDTGEDCAGLIWFRGGRAKGAGTVGHAEGQREGPEWDILKEDPITLSPSVLCNTCGAHGWIQEGRWVSC